MRENLPLWRKDSNFTLQMKITDSYSQLPVAAIAGEVNASLEKVARLVVTAPPGAGKSTLLPLSILEALPGGSVIMLEPRRLAARQVAGRMASMLGEPVGHTVGYRVRFESRVSDATRILVVTEGILERMLVDDPTLEGVGAVIFDEYHERSLASDVALALTREAQDVVRPDLRIVVMSATIDATALCARLDAPHIHAPGRMHDVEIVYGEDFDPRDCAAEVARAVSRAHRRHEGDILAFLPGQGEIARCAELLEGTLGATELLPLYGMLPPEGQRRVMSPPPAGTRRVVLATPIAETSLTIEGITVVVDSGLCRTPVFDPGNGLSRLATVAVSLDMATQRAGRAGRTAPGICYRLWSRAAGHRMKESREPEIMTADLAPVVLETAAWGEPDPLRLPWISPPPAGHVASGRALLRALDAIDDAGRITAVGRDLSRLPCHPRIARMLTATADPRLASLACDIAALLEEKDPLGDDSDADITTRLTLLRQYRLRRGPGRWKRILDIAAQYRRLTGCKADDGGLDPYSAGRLIAIAYPERIAMRAPDGRLRLAGGDYTTLHKDDALSGERFLAVATMGSRIFLAAPLAEADVASRGAWSDVAVWDSRAGRAVVRGELRVGVLVVDTRQPEEDMHEAVCRAICRAAPRYGLTMFDFNDDVERMQMRVATVAEWHPELELPPVDTATLLERAAEWLPLYIGRASGVAELRKIDMCAVISGLLDYDQQKALDRIAPTHIKLPCGRNARVDYRRGAEAPVVRARLQDCFGLTDTPRLDGGARPVLMELLSPGFKPVQLTQDMAGFWRDTYFEVRKELRRRYPKHPWPDNPLTFAREPR